ncbi:hypothetical protein GALL_217940 [mine drainage metagenome]|uniref:Uncharacterized protein n=1 Tax=mine drainage metagenome TaxID=410659 RepID=A0A1J5S7A0_9ZZZZ
MKDMRRLTHWTYWLFMRMLTLQLDQVAHLIEQHGRKRETYRNAPLSEAGQGTMR